MKSIQHYTLGYRLAAEAKRAGADLVICESQCADWLFIKATDEGCCLIAGEIECSERNALANVLRDVTVIHANAVITLCANEKVRDRVAAIFAKHLAKRFKSRVAMFTANDLESGAIQEWLSGHYCGSNSELEKIRKGYL